MIRLNSRLTAFYKYCFPAVWFGFLLFFLVMAPTSTDDPIKRLIFMLAPFPMAAFGYFLMRKLFFGLANQVYREANKITCITGSKQVNFVLEEIQSAVYYRHSQPHKVVLRLRRQTDFGREIEFIPKINGRIFTTNPDIEKLLDDVDAINHPS